MITKKIVCKWGQTERTSFESIKQAIIDAPSLSSPDFFKEFDLYTFASEQPYAAVLTQPNE